METRDKIVIVSSVIGVAIVVVLATVSWSYYNNGLNHIVFCNNWVDDLNEQNNRLGNQSYITPEEATQYNQALEDYKKECQY